jgi:hypothetical protein
MRHTAATLLKNLGVPARDAQLILGHSNIVTTQQIYQHDDLDSRRDALERLEKQFSHDGNADSEEGSALPSKLPSTLVASLDAQREKTPSWRLYLNKFMAGMEGFEPPNAGTRSRSDLTVGERITEVERIVQTWRRTWFIGVAAVHLAVNHAQPSDRTQTDEGEQNAVPVDSTCHR